MPDTRARLAEIAVVMIPVSDQDAALRFYTEVLGMEKVADIPYAGEYRWLEVAIPGAPTRISLVTPMDGFSAGRPTGISFRTTDITALHAQLSAAGVDADELMAAGGPVPAMFFFRDPDGNRLHVTEG
jgi:catechol 2,3-dioxygenase-like lactoylglutathione lyase family enzyme